MTDAAKEGPRGFSVFIQQIDDGALHSELSKSLQEVTSTLTDQVSSLNADQKGTITITLSFAARRNGTVDVAADVKTKTPKPKRAGSVFWATKGGNLSLENPRQASLPLREVSAPRVAVVAEPEAEQARAT